MDPSIAKVLSDQDLAAAVHGSGSIPSWAALAELQHRNNVRSSAPVAQPQGTIAQDVVGRALRSSGIMGPSMAPSMVRSNPAQPQAPAPAPDGGITAGSQPQGFAKGGPVRLAAGGNPVLDTLTSAGVIPNIDESSLAYNPVQYTPAVTPDATTLDQAAAKVAPLYGNGPDYDRTLAAVRGETPPTPNQGVGKFITNLLAGTLSGKGNALQSFGEGLGNAQQLEEAGQQQGFKNRMAQNQQVAGIQKDQDVRQRAIADSAMQYRNVNAQIADAQAREAAETARGNSEGALQAAHERAQLEIQKSSAVDSFLKGMGNPLFAASYGNMAKQRGDAAGAQLAQDAIDSWKNQQQTTSDISQNREMAVARAQHAARMNEIMSEQAAMHNYKMQELGLASDGKGGFSATPGSPLDEEAKKIAFYKSPGPSPMSLTRPQAAALLARINNFNPNYDATYYKPIQDLREKANPNGTGLGANVLAANNAMAHLDLLGKFGAALNNGNFQAINTLKNNLSAQFGSAAPTNFDGVKHQVAGELVALLKRNGVPDKEATEQVSNGMQGKNSPEQLNGYIDSQIQIAGAKMMNTRSMAAKTPGLPPNDPVLDQLGYTPEAKKALYDRGFDPANPNAGKVLSGLPGGFGKTIDHDTAVKFVKAAGGDIDHAKQVMKDFGWELPQ